MSGLRKLYLGIRALARRRAADREMDDELRAFVDAAAEAKIRAGMSRREALRAARVEMGSPDAVKENVRDAGWETALDSVWRDVTYAFRGLRKSPGFALTVAFILALGIAANTMVFSIVNWLVIRPLPIAKPAQMVFLAYPRGSRNFDDQLSIPELDSIREGGAHLFSGVSGICFGGTLGGHSGPDGLTVDGVTRTVGAVFVSANFFSMLGLQPHLGRLILPSENRNARPSTVVVLSYRYWMSRFRGDPGIVGKQAALDGHPVTIVGIAPKGFHGVTPIVDMEAYLPLQTAALEFPNDTRLLSDPKARFLWAIARLRQDTSLAQAQAALQVIGSRLAEQDPRPRGEVTLSARPLRPPGLLNGPNPLPALAALFLTLGILVLTLAGVDVVNLLLVRALMRSREMALRAALGASRSRLLRQMLTESLLLAAGGGVGGLWLGLLGARAISSIPIQSDVPLVFDLSFDWRVFAYTFAVAVLAGLLVGIVPALRAARKDLSQTLREEGRGVTTGRKRLRGALVAAQIGVSLALLVAAGLFLRSLESVRHVDLGFNPANLLNLRVDPNAIGYSPAQRQTFYRALLDRVRAMRGVRSAALTQSLPMGEDVFTTPVSVPGYRAQAEQEQPSAIYDIVSTGYFSTMGIRLLRGRDFTAADGPSAASVAIINQKMADRFWPRENPVGRSFTAGPDFGKSLTVVGVVNNSRIDALFGPFEPAFYVPLAQHDSAAISLQVRGAGPVEALTPGLLSQIEALAPGMAVYGIRTMSQTLGGVNGYFLFNVGAALVGGLGLLGLTLAVVGVYGVVSYDSGQRTREIGIRMAFGARPAQIFGGIYWKTAWVLVTGLAAGLALAFALGRLSASFLVGVGPADPLTFAGVSLLLILVALAACYVPARRATRVDPITVLRHE